MNEFDPLGIALICLMSGLVGGIILGYTIGWLDARDAYKRKRDDKGKFC